MPRPKRLFVRYTRAMEPAPESPLPLATHLALKMMSVGAHSINNQLTIVMICIADALEQMCEDDPLRPSMRQACDALNRAVHVTHGLSSFAYGKGVSGGSMSFEQVLELCK